MKSNSIFSFDVENLFRLERHAKKQNRSKSSIVNEALVAFLDAQETAQGQVSQVERVTSAVVDRLFDGVPNGR